MKFALVDGALGHTGSFMVKLLIDSGWSVVATDLAKEERKKIMTKEKIFDKKREILDCRKWKNVSYIPSDLTKKKSLENLFNPDNFPNGRNNYDVIYHPASLYDYGASYELLHEINYKGLKNFLEVILEYSKKINYPPPHFIHWSTCGIYGEPNYQKDENGFIFPVDENAPYNPPNNYSQTKVEQEKLLKSIAVKNSDFNYTILRSAPIFGPYQSYGMFHIFLTIHMMGYTIMPKVYPKRRKLLMPMVHVKDLVKSALFLTNHEKAYGEIFNILYDSPLQEDWLEFVCNEVGAQFSFIPMPWGFYQLLAKFTFYLAKLKNKEVQKEGRRPKFDLPMVEYLTHQYYFSNEKIKSLGFSFDYENYEKAIRETIEWYRDHNWLPMKKIVHPSFLNKKAKTPVPSEEIYNTPMEGGKIF